MPQPHVQVVLSDETPPPALDEALRRINASTSFSPLTDARLRAPTRATDAVVVVRSRDPALEASDLSALLWRISERPRGILIVSDNPSDSVSEPFVGSIPVTHGCGDNADELTGRLLALVSMKPSLEALERRRRDVHKREAANEAFRRQVRLAQTIQRSMMPSKWPAVGALRFSAVQRSARDISGDLCDVQRLDRSHVGVLLADAAGEGVPAAMLSVFVRRALNAVESKASNGRIARPGNVLTRLNHEVIDSDLDDSEFIAALYAVINAHTGHVQLARAGTPYPLHRRAAGEPRRINTSGCVLGIDRDAAFSTETFLLSPGDALVCFTDGIQCLEPALSTVSEPTADAPGTDRWARLLAQRGIAESFSQLTTRHDLVRRLGQPVDDATALAVEFAHEQR